MTRSLPSYRSKGSALVSTLLVIVVLSIIVAAFMQSMSIERQTARSYLKQLQAQLAADAAEADAISNLIHDTENDVYSITQTNFSPSATDRPPICFISQPQTTNSTVKYTPLVSGSNLAIPAKPMGQMPGPQEIFNESASKYVSRSEPKLPSYLSSYYANSIETRWVYLKDSSGSKELSRFCYWVEDLQGRLDLAVVGHQPGTRGEYLGSTDHDKHVAEIALFTLFDKTAKTDSASTNAATLINNRTHLFTSATVKQYVQTVDASEPNASEPQRYFYYGLGYETKEPDIIPPGFGFTNAGQPKIALNDIITKSDALTTITDAIDKNLPKFADTRRGGMNKELYLKNLAANIIDYADSDAQATTDESTYRGLDSFPLVSQWFMQTGYTTSGTKATFTNRFFIEIWNMSDKTISGTVRFRMTNGYTATVAGRTVRFYEIAPADTHYEDKNVTLNPNAKAVLNMGYHIKEVDTAPLTPPSSITMNESFGSYLYYWSSGGSDFKLVDRSGTPGTTPGKYININGKAGVWLVGKGFAKSASPPNTNWNYSIANLTHRIGNTVGNTSFLDGSIGDPRATYYISGPMDQSAYDTRATVGGRASRTSLTGKTYGETRPSYWPDPGFDGTFGTSVSSSLPTSVTPPQLPENQAMVHYGNYADSKYRSITELGNIYDPGQWEQYAGQHTQTDLNATVQKGLADITNSSEGSDYYGGGYTLRIGRPEFTRFDNSTSDKYTEISRASALLGIFSTEATHSTRGLININTASRDVLRALGAGITMTNPKWTKNEGDTFQSTSTPSEIYGPTSSIQADKFADAIIASRPFYSQHELAARLKTSSQVAFWGNPNVWDSGKPTTWRDAAAEEYLRQIYDLTTVRSRNFRIHITGQSFNERGDVVSTSRRIADIYLQYHRDASPAYTTVQHLYEISP